MNYPVLCYIIFMKTSVFHAAVFSIHKGISYNLVSQEALGSIVGIVTSYGMEGPGIESRWGRDFPHLSRPPLGPTQPPVQWVPALSRSKERPGREADPSSPSSAVVMKGYSRTSTPPMGRTACTEPQCLYKGALLH